MNYEIVLSFRNIRKKAVIVAVLYDWFPETLTQYSGEPNRICLYGLGNVDFHGIPDFLGKVIAGFPEQVKDYSSSFILVLRTKSSINFPAKPNCLLP